MYLLIYLHLPFNHRLFKLNDIMKNPEYSGEKAQGFDWDNITGEAIDETTFRITLKEPDGLLLQQLASVKGPGHFAPLRGRWLW